MKNFMIGRGRASPASGEEAMAANADTTTAQPHASRFEPGYSSEVLGYGLTSLSIRLSGFAYNHEADFMSSIRNLGGTTYCTITAVGS